MNKKIKITKRLFKRFVKIPNEENHEPKYNQGWIDFAYAFGYYEGIIFFILTNIITFFVILVFIGILPFFKTEMKINLTIVVIVSVVISIILCFSHANYLMKTAGKKNQEIGDSSGTSE